LARASWNAFAPEYTLNFLSPETARKYVSFEEHPLCTRCAEGRIFAEWIRLYLLAKHGGVWLDASIILTAPLSLSVNDTANISGFDLGGKNFEASFIAAYPGDRLINTWLQEYVKICEMTDKEYYQWILHFKAEGIELLNGEYASCDWASNSWYSSLFHDLVQSGRYIGNLFIRYTKVYIHACGESYWITYLKINTSLNAALRTTGHWPGDLWNLYGIHTQRTEYTMMKVAALQSWDDDRVAAFLRSSGSGNIDMHAMRGVKLTKGDRDALDRYSTCEQGSLLSIVQNLTSTEAFQVVPPSEFYCTNEAL
jgi:hypothetical protein